MNGLGAAINSSLGLVDGRARRLPPRRRRTLRRRRSALASLTAFLALAVSVAVVAYLAF
jgi:hypothetical protein